MFEPQLLFLLLILSLQPTQSATLPATADTPPVRTVRSRLELLQLKGWFPSGFK